MGIPRKGSRTVVVDEKNYRFIVKGPAHQPCCCEIDDAVSVIVQEIDNAPGNILRLCADYWVAITKKDMHRNIRHAIEQGWEPHKRGGVVSRRWMGKEPVE